MNGWISFELMVFMVVVVVVCVRAVFAFRAIPEKAVCLVLRSSSFRNSFIINFSPCNSVTTRMRENIKFRALKMRHRRRLFHYINITFMCDTKIIGELCGIFISFRIWNIKHFNTIFSHFISLFISLSCLLALFSPSSLPFWSAFSGWHKTISMQKYFARKLCKRTRTKLYEWSWLFLSHADWKECKWKKVNDWKRR